VAGARVSTTSTPRQLVNPALIEHARERRRSLENRLADRITTFSGSMQFVYLHIAWFTGWIVFRVEDYPFGLLTMIVSLEAIFLSTFVMISQNRADSKREVLANHEWQTVQEESAQNEDLLRLVREILELARASADGARSAAPSGTPRARGDRHKPTATDGIT
jgi:uncharacterized membrane protein